MPYIQPYGTGSHGGKEAILRSRRIFWHQVSHLVRIIRRKPSDEATGWKDAGSTGTPEQGMKDMLEENRDGDSRRIE